MANIHVMLDLETMGTGVNSAITAIGAAYFDEKGTGETFYKVVDLTSCVRRGLDIEPATVLWWLEQSDAARRELLRLDAEPLDYALASFTQFLDDLATAYSAQSIHVWGNGPGFDNEILKNAYIKVGMDVPWSWWNDRCYRTLSMLYPEFKTALPESQAHNALNDALHQAKCAARMLAAAAGAEDPKYNLKRGKSE